MAQSSGLTSGARKLADTAEEWLNKVATPHKKRDTSADDADVRKANESFRKGSEDDKAAAEKKAAQSRKVISTPSKSGTAAKNTTSAKKSPTRKRIEGK
jgi:pyruvate/2-oxoglutarate dehydrogenase complex dihydrolipoamide acyltransferase (E2) component